MVDEEGLDCERSDLVSAAVVEVGEVEGMVEIRIVSAVGYRRPTRIGVVGPGQPFLRPGWGEDRGAGADRAGVGDVAVEELRVEAVLDVEPGHIHAVVGMEVAEHDGRDPVGVDRLLQRTQRPGSEVEDDAGGCVLVAFDEVAAGERCPTGKGPGGADGGELHSSSSPCVRDSKVVVSRSWIQVRQSYGERVRPLVSGSFSRRAYFSSGSSSVLLPSRLASTTRIQM